METFLTGYCRLLDSPRTVLVDTEEDLIDCSFRACPHSSGCPIGRQISEILRGEGKEPEE